MLLQAAFSLSVGKEQLFVGLWSMAVSADAPTSGGKKHLMKGWLWSTGVWLWAWSWLSLYCCIPVPGVLGPFEGTFIMKTRTCVIQQFVAAAAAAAVAKSLQSCPTPCDPIDGSPPGSPVPGQEEEGSPVPSPGKKTGVGCHFLLQCMKVKSESEVTQSCPTHRDPMDCSLPGSSVHGIFQARVLEWGAITFSKQLVSMDYNF